jgi:N-acetylmuramoyl-L-alanine amidase
LVVSFFAISFLMAESAAARVTHGDSWARDKFTKAEQAREALNGRPAKERTRKDYQRVVDDYRRVYFGAPTASKADPSVVATAELLVEMGRQFDDDEVLHQAIEQYQFLRKEYPGSKYRFDALFTIGEIYKDDLNDPAKAKSTFEEFLHRYPRNRLADDAKQALNEMAQEAAAREAAQREAARKGKARSAKGGSSGGGVSASSAAGSATAKDVSSSSVTIKDLPLKAGKSSAAKDLYDEQDAATDDSAQSAVQNPADVSRGRLPRVTSIRHWSTPDYTRVAIDVEQEIKFDSQRIDGPDRIFFDLHDTKLASTLVGKTFDVDDGFLKKIRVAQYQPGRTRVVLEVDNLSEYNYFMLPNPYRLIIDVHGKKAATAVAKNEPGPLTSGDTLGQEMPRGADDAVVPALEADSGKASGPLKAKPAAQKSVPQDASCGTDSEDDSANCAKSAKTADDGLIAPDVTREVAAKGAATSKASAPRKPVPKKVVEADGDSDDAGSVAESKPAEQKPVAVKTAKAKTTKPVHAAVSEAAAVSDNGDGTGVRSGRKIKSADGNNDEVATLDPADIPLAAKSTARPATVFVAPPAEQTKPKAVKTRSSKVPPPSLETVTHEAQPTSSGERSLIRALGLKIGRIVIDPGHGGHDTGTIGPNGLQEKDVVLEVGRRLGKLLETRLGAEVVYTREDDTFIPLETRTAIANQEQADLFISIHANSSDDPSARGVETYYLNFTSSHDALEVAARENAVSEKSIHELQDLVKKIALKEKIEESHEFAADVQQSLYSGLASKSPAIRDRGVKKAPFIVLIGANMPSILAEISFVSNPTDEKKMETAEYRQRMAESLYRGIAKYVSGLSGVKVAKMTKNPEQ